MDRFRTHRSFVSYIDRSRDFYAAHGYSRPYAWAHYGDVPFSVLKKPLFASRVGMVTTAGKPGFSNEETGNWVRDLYAAPADPPPEHLYTDDLFWDKEATNTDDIDSFLPVNRLAQFAACGRIGSASPRFYGVPTDYSQSRTMQVYAPGILDLCREDSCDAVLLMAL
jgi:hypothetical protein